MWTTSELVDIENSLEPVKIESICTSEEIDIIAQNSTRLRNLKTGITVPQNHRIYSNLRITQIWNNIDLYDWVCAIP